MDIWWTLHLKRDPASVPLARRILLSAMETAGVDPQVAHDLGVALTEACANAVEHAVSGRPDEGFQVTASIAGDRLRIEVVDSGPGLPSSALPQHVPAGPASVPSAVPGLPTGVPALAARPAFPALPAAATAATALPGGAPAAPALARAGAVPALPMAGPTVRRSMAPPARPAAGRRRSRRGRAALSVPVLTAHRPRRTDRPAPYDTHVLPAPPLCSPAAASADSLFVLQGLAELADFPEFRDLPLPELPALDAESGRGLFLIHALADHVQLRNHPLRGAIVSFDKILKRRDGSLLRAVS
ncbi:serine/threonine-protein kinase RsbW [Kitasatospora sp. GP82]|nr:ATP-binding protein [Kitasatospora sp. GP82]MDH6128946.1 serine/threonine-protein kinase RsbW [Kitasatospora sp. GP82]